MTFEEFQKSGDEPADLSQALLGLWRDAQGEWDGAHQAVQDDSSRDAAWVHAYLHRKEGDISNARYWYARAGRQEFSGDLHVEWEEIARELLSRSS